jgi:hypothetical protein
MVQIQKKKIYLGMIERLFYLLHGGVEGEGMIIRNTVENPGCPGVEIVNPGQTVRIAMPTAYIFK